MWSIFLIRPSNSLVRLNEGFTVYYERLIVAKMDGKTFEEQKKIRDFAFIGAYCVPLQNCFSKAFTLIISFVYFTSRKEWLKILTS